MAFNFPANPVLDEEYTSDDVSFVWNGEIWTISTDSAFVAKSGDIMSGPLILPGETVDLLGAVPLKQLNDIIQGAIVSDQPPPGAKHGTLWFNSTNGDFNIRYTDPDSSQWVQVSAGGNGGEFLPLEGGTLTGPIVLPSNPPSIPTHATHKSYVDSAISAKSLYQSVWQVAANVPDLTPAVALPLHGYSWVAATVDPLVPETAPAALPGIGGTLIGTNDNIIWNANTNEYEHLKSATSGSAYLPLSGGDLSGALKVKGDGTVGQVWLTNGNATANGQVEFRAADDVRAAYIGWGSATTINFALEGATALKVTGGNVQAEGGVSMGAATAASATDLTRHLALYGTTFGFNITGGTMNYVVPDANKHDFYCGTLNALSLNKTTLTLNAHLTMAAGKNLTVEGALTANGGINIGANQDVYFAAGNNVGYNTTSGHYHNTDMFHTFWVDGAQKVGIDGSGITEYNVMAADGTRSDINVGQTLALLLARVKMLEAEIETLKGAR